MYFCCFSVLLVHCSYKASETDKKDAMQALTKYDTLTDDEDRRRFLILLCVHTQYKHNAPRS